MERIINKESIGGIFLLVATLFALIASNTGLQAFYHHFLDIPVKVQIGDLLIDKPLVLWINDGLMSIFFFAIGLELKRECLTGHLRDVHNIILPTIAAIGGVVIPVCLFVFFNIDDPKKLTGWAIPMATDIAFAIGVCALFSSRVPTRMKIFLLTLAIIDDIAAILVIAIFYTDNLSWSELGIGGICIVLLAIMNWRHVDRLPYYIFIGIVLWVSVLKSGVHGTISGVLLAMFIPLESRNGTPLLKLIERDLHFLVNYVTLPLFAFANAGVELTGLPSGLLSNPLMIGIALGLCIGKPVGIVSFSAVYRAMMRISDAITLHELMTVGCLAGIGFTMSLFIASLSFGYSYYMLNVSRAGILLGTAISILFSIALLLRLPMIRTSQRAIITD